MLGWAFGFFIAALVAAAFGLSGIAATFTGIAIIMFWVFLALAVLSLLFNTFGGSHAGRVGGGNAFAAVALVGGVALLAYAWVDNDMSAERVGRAIDRQAAQLAENTSDALGQAGNRAGDLAGGASDEIRSDAADGLDQASDTVEPETDEPASN